MQGHPIAALNEGLVPFKDEVMGTAYSA